MNFLLFYLYLATNALRPGVTKEFWPTSNAYKGAVCGSVTEFTISANQTCTIELTKGRAAFVNAGGLMSASPSDGRTFNVAMPFEQSEPVRFLTLYENTKTWYRQGKMRYPIIWELECFNQEDNDSGQTPAVIECQDNEKLEGVFMMGFGTDNVGSGRQSVQIYSSSSLSKGTMVSFVMRNKDDKGVVVDNVETSANSTIMMGQAAGQFAILLNENYGHYLQVEFDYPEKLKPFEMAQAFYSSVTV